MRLRLVAALVVSLVALCLTLRDAAVAHAQDSAPTPAPLLPMLQNGRFETRRGAISAEIELARSASHAVWIGWRVAVLGGDRDLCSTWTTDRERVRGVMLDPSDSPLGRPVFAAPSGPVALERGTGLLVLLRVIDVGIERVRSLGDDCPIDAGGLTVRWLPDVTSAQSVAFLETLATNQLADGTGQQAVRDSAIAAIALHGDRAADAALARLVAPASDRSVRGTAARWLASARGASGFSLVRAELQGETDARMRRTLASALGSSPRPEAVPVLLALAREDPDNVIRADAVAAYAKHGATRAAPTLAGLLELERTESVRRRIVASLASIPEKAGLDTLLQLARSATDVVVRREAVGALARVDDPRAMAYLEGLVR